MRKLIFVYNTQSGVIPYLLGYAQKTFSPTKHACKLSVLTLSPIGMRRQWKSFLRKLDVPTEFLQYDQVLLKYPKALYKNYPHISSYPCLLLKADDGISIVLTSEEINGCSSLDELIDLVTKKLMK